MPAPYTIAITVKNVADALLSGATVTLTLSSATQTAITNISGIATFYVPTAGTWGVSVSAAGYAGNTSTVTTTGGAATVTLIAAATSTTMGYTFATLKAKLGGMYANASAAATEIAGFVNEAVFAFYRARQWGFLKTAASVTLTAGVQTVDMPAGFGFASGKIILTKGSIVRQLHPMSQDEIEAEAVLHGTDQTIPEWYCIRYKAFDPAVGQRRELVVYPYPDDTYAVNIPYRLEPAPLLNDGDYPLGSEAHSPTILQGCLAIWEQRRMKRVGAMTALYVQMLRDSISRDGDNDQYEQPERLGEDVD